MTLNSYTAPLPALAESHGANILTSASAPSKRGCSIVAFKRLRAKNVALENVTLDKITDFTGAQVESLTRNITKLTMLNLITTGSSVNFD